MNYSRYITNDMLNGEGVRCTLWVSGCDKTPKCKGCFNMAAASPKSGMPFTEEQQQDILKDLNNPLVSGLTLLGGEPFARWNFPALINMASLVKQELTCKDIWCYTYRKFEDLLLDVERFELLKILDVLVDGEFILELSQPAPKWCGSSNQRVIDVQKSLQSGIVTLYGEDQ